MPKTKPRCDTRERPEKTLRKDERKENEKMKKLTEQEIKKLLEESENKDSEKLLENKNGEDAHPEKEEENTKNLSSKEAEFEKLIKGEFKEQFEQRMKENLKRRFKESSDAKAKTAENDRIVNLLMMKYGIGDGDTVSLMEAIKSDDGFIKTEAEKMGIDSETLKKLKRLEYENEVMKNRLNRQKADFQMEQTIGQWIRDGEFLKENYPSFDLEQESSNPAFLNLLRGGADLRSAYLAMHHDEIVKDLVEKASNDAKTQAAEAIKARGMRPLENGMSGKSAALFKTNVSALTPEQRAEIAARVARGELISF